MFRLPFVLIMNAFSLVGYALDMVVYGIALLFRKRKRYVVFKPKSSYPWGEPSGAARLMKSGKSWLELRKELEKAAEDDGLDGIIIRLKEPLAMGPATLAQLQSWLEKCREAQKEVIFHSDLVTTRDYALATSADQILVSPPGRLYTFGLRFQQFFAAEILRKLSIRAQFIHIGSFKTAANRFVKDSASPAQNGMMTELLDRLRDLEFERVETRVDAEAASRLHAEAPIDASRARDLGFIDGEVFWDDVSKWLDAREEHIQLSDGAEEPGYSVLDWSDWENSRRPELNWRPLFRKRKLALVDLTGMIVNPETNLPGGTVTIDPSQVLPVLRRIKNDPRVAGLLIHVNSPGGSALSSDIIWKAIEEVRARKPVVSYCSDVAGSGGYYLAVGADRIYCHRESIIGSIGVITGKMSFGEAARRAGLGIEPLTRDESSSFMDLFAPLDGELLENFHEDARSFYRRFLERVGQARKIPRRRLHRYARGRVYLGEDAHRRGLVDGVGGFEEAVEALHQLIEMDPDRTELTYFAHRRTSLSDAIRSSLVEVSTPTTGIPEMDDELRATRQALALLSREKTLALMDGKWVDG